MLFNPFLLPFSVSYPTNPSPPLYLILNNALCQPYSPYRVWFMVGFIRGMVYHHTPHIYTKSSVRLPYQHTSTSTSTLPTYPSILLYPLSSEYLTLPYPPTTPPCSLPSPPLLSSSILPLSPYNIPLCPPPPPLLLDYDKESNHLSKV